MHPILLILIVLIFVVFGYLYYASNPQTLLNLAKLNDGTTNTIDKTKIDMPGSSRYYYEGWFNIDNNFPVDKNNVLFSRGKRDGSTNVDTALVLKGSKLTLYANKGTIDGRGVYSPGSSADSGYFSVDITPAFPFQKWVYIVVHVDGGNVDIYLDGRLISNHKDQPIKYDKDSADLIVGNANTEGRVILFNRVVDNITPQEVWNNYLYTSAQGVPGSSYKINVDILKNNAVSKSVSLTT